MKGKDICETLRDIRRRIASANGIDYTPAVCTHEGDCPGTCPRCEGELRYIERQLLRRRAMGKTVVLAGLALGAASFSPVHAQQTAVNPAAVQASRRIVDAAPGDTTAVLIRGRVLDKETREACVGVTVLLVGTKYGMATDLDGNFAIRVPLEGKLQFTYVGYESLDYVAKQAVDGIEILMPPDDDSMLTGIVVISDKMHPVDADIYVPR